LFGREAFDVGAVKALPAFGEGSGVGDEGAVGDGLLQGVAGQAVVALDFGEADEDGFHGKSSRFKVSGFRLKRKSFWFQVSGFWLKRKSFWFQVSGFWLKRKSGQVSGCRLQKRETRNEKPETLFTPHSALRTPHFFLLPSPRFFP
jgi:hypothetical protein